MTGPLIGITLHPKTAPDRDELDNLLEGVISGVERAGGLPLLIPLGLAESALRGIYDQLDGVLVPGGGDIHPAQYGAELHSTISGVNVERDRAEMTLVRWAATGDSRKPFFGICRGMQVLNVALGGSLYPDVSEFPGADRHDFPSPIFPNNYQAHEIRIEEESVLAQIVRQPIIKVNSLHHQFCKKIAPGLQATALASDGVVEAIEAPDRPLAFGVQWHPECLPDVPAMVALFGAFVEAAEAKHDDTNSQGL